MVFTPFLVIGGDCSKHSNIEFSLGIFDSENLVAPNIELRTGLNWVNRRCFRVS